MKRVGNGILRGNASGTGRKWGGLRVYALRSQKLRLPHNLTVSERSRMRCSVRLVMARIRIRSAVILIGALLCTPPGATPAWAQEASTQIGATLSRWLLASETPTTLAASAWGLKLSATRWRGSRGIGGSILVSPGVSGSIPPLLGLHLQGALRSSSRAQSIWPPVADALVGLGLLHFSDHVSYLVGVCDYSDQCRGDPDFRPGWLPFLSIAGGLNIPLPRSIGFRGEVAADLPIRDGSLPGGGRFAYFRFGLGLSVRP